MTADISLWAIGRLVVVDRVRKLLTIEVHPDYPESIPADRVGGPVSLFIGDRPPTGIAQRERERVLNAVLAWAEDPVRTLDMDDFRSYLELLRQP